ncbi:uncharacterized protein LOC106658312 [Trichogramma pretiosum]|uniref:uncharacterized protein LOC106658312 n=1 Tax=Trichogramma pretiosum TaxID=7493 RepID=UPI000C71C699|nr:uncharacterized protein LOC106658312 [Trichogramma pretiosum]
MKYLVSTILLATCCLCQDVIFPDQLQALKEASEYDLSKQKDEESEISNQVESLKARMKSNDKIELSTDLKDKIRDDLSKGLTRFTLSLDETLEDGRGSAGGSVNENLVFSPLSLQTLLATILLASKGRTFEEVARVLNLNPSGPLANHSEIFHHFFGQSILETLDNSAGVESLKFNFGTGVFLEV